MNGNLVSGEGDCDGNGEKNSPASILAENNLPSISGNLWDPLRIFSCPASYEHAIVILNRPLNWDKRLLFNIWKKARVTATVDGGTDRWITFLGQRKEDMLNGESDEFLPDLISGDMDSILPDTLKKLQQLGANVIDTPDQNATDYTKALLQLGAYAKSKEINLDGIYVFADTSGRLDHILANINTLFKSDEFVGDAQVIQVSKHSLTWLLRPGIHRIFIPEQLIRKKSWCALMPVGSRVTSITTSGLKWNLESASMEFGHLVSTSNTYSGNSEVTVKTDTPVLWSMDIKPLVETT